MYILSKNANNKIMIKDRKEKEIMTKARIRRGRVLIAFFITGLIAAGSGGYLYYIKHTEPTQGIFVYDPEMRKEFACGHLYQSS